MSETADAMTAIEVADYLRVHRITIYRMVEKGILHPYRVGRIWRFNRVEISALSLSGYHPKLKGVPNLKTPDMISEALRRRFSSTCVWS